VTLSLVTTLFKTLGILVTTRDLSLCPSHRKPSARVTEQGLECRSLMYSTLKQTCCVLCAVCIVGYNNGGESGNFYGTPLYHYYTLVLSVV